MIAIIDSGSTKSDWVVLDKQGREIQPHPKTAGLNPYFLSSKTIEEEIRKGIGESQEFSKRLDEVTHIFFYGAGCSAPHYVNIIKEALDKIFPKSKNIVKHDLLAAAYACYNGEPVISCILGTGSNSCYFDGEKLIEKTHSLAYVLGDEGSGSYIGKRVLRYYFLKKMPLHLSEAFETFIQKENIQWEINREEDKLGKKFSKEQRETRVKKLEIENRKLPKTAREYNIFSQMNKNVYNNPFANRYLAGFNKFVSEHQAREPFLQQIIYNSFKDFIVNQILVYRHLLSKKTKLSFIGSIAFCYKGILERALWEYHLELGEIIQKPIEKLVGYHRKHILPGL